MPSKTSSHPSKNFLPDAHPPIANGKIGILLVNLGTPDGYDKKSMRRYLKEFLSDRRVIETPRWKWYPILYGIVLNTRPAKSGAAYKTIWNEKLDESPLRTITRSQAEKLAAVLKQPKQLVVDWAMRYGQPAIADQLEELKAKGCDRILVFPLYPQYCAATTASVCDKVFEALTEMRWMPAIRTVPAYHDDPAYIEALANSIEGQLSKLKKKPEKIIASYHGIPQSYFDDGDPYHCHCMKTSRLLRERLGFSEEMLITTFQSRFGPDPWLQPYTDKTIEAIACDGVKNIAVINPGFSADCLETLEEIAGEAAEIFLHNGGEEFTHIPCLNDSADGIKVIRSVVQRELSGWI